VIVVMGVAVLMVMGVAVIVVMAMGMAVIVVMGMVMLMRVSAFRVSGAAYSDRVVMSASAGITHGLLVLFNKQ
jgi:hypothetical protein